MKPEIRIIESCGDISDIAFWCELRQGNKKLMCSFTQDGFYKYWTRKSDAINFAEKLSKLTGIKFNSTIIKQHGC